MYGMPCSYVNGSLCRHPSTGRRCTAAPRSLQAARDLQAVARERYNTRMTEPATTLDPQRQDQAREYARIRRRLWMVQLALGVLYLGTWILAGWSFELQDILRQVPPGGLLPFEPPWWASLILTALALALPWTLLTIPIRYYSGFVLPHRYGLSTQHVTGWISDNIKGGLLSALIGAPLLVALYGVIRNFPRTWWVWAAAGYSLVSVVLTTLAPVVLMPLFFKFEPLQQEQQELVDRLRRLARQAGTRIQGVYSVDMSRRTRAANAALVGLGKTRRILLGDTLVDEFTTDEIETIMAHELAHHVHKDIPLGLFVGTALEFGTFFLASQFLQISVNRLPLDSLADPAGLPFLALFFGATGLISTPLGNAYSRWREAMADDYALKVTNKPEHFASAFTRLANQNLAEADPSRWARRLLASHPPLKERIAKAERFAQSTSNSSVEGTST